jgi:predicted enzyme related to lactoylglutathione lyase
MKSPSMRGFSFEACIFEIIPELPTLECRFKNFIMKKVTGLGGIFFKCEDPQKISEWYKKHLGFSKMAGNSAMFEWKKVDGGEEIGTTVWSPFKQASTYFEPSASQFMFNFIVEDLSGLMEELKKEGVQVVGEMQEYEYGKFGWILDPEGNKIELWEPASK